MFKQTSLEDALELSLGATKPIGETESLSLDLALGRILADEVRALYDNPPFDRSPLDGFATRSEDTALASLEKPIRLKVTEVVYAGQVLGRSIQPNEAVRIMTGAAMPEGADSMVPLEAVREEGDQVLIYKPLNLYENYIFQGEDIKRGEVLLQAGVKLDSVRLGLLGGMGLNQIQVFRQPRLGLYCVGDEFSKPEAPLQPGKIYNSNGVTLTARLKEYGLPSQRCIILPDDPATAANEIASVIDELDLIITTGSVSVGDKDIMPEVFRRLGITADISRLDFKPGTAFLTGLYRGKRILCLSGNPFAALATMELVVRPVLAKLTRDYSLLTRRIKAELQTAFPGGKSKNIRRFLRGSLNSPESGQTLTVSLPEDHSSGRMFSMIGRDCLVDLPPGVNNLPSGQIVEVVDLRLNRGHLDPPDLDHWDQAHLGLARREESRELDRANS
jgi:molybdopterin molybdotransferase